MSTFKTENIKIIKEGKTLSIVDKESFDSFNEDILGLGKLELAPVVGTRYCQKNQIKLHVFLINLY